MPSILIDHTGPVVTVTLNRPDVRNAFNDELTAALTAWACGPMPDGARVAVLRGAGKVFCAGADLTWMAEMASYTRDENVRDAHAMAEMFQALDTLPLPLIGRIHGAALGGGAGLAAVCDIVVAATDAVFGFTEAKLGILPAVISPFAVAKIGVSAARELFLTAARFSATRAREIGLAHAVAPLAELDATVDAYVNEIATSAPEALTAAKRLIADVTGRPVQDVGDLTAETIARHRVSREGQDGMRAFLEKRRASWVPAEK
ncbi:MAG: enoyl-CoA hydratase-related protein [Vicinamibacterales bacterium]